MPQPRTTHTWTLCTLLACALILHVPSMGYRPPHAKNAPESLPPLCKLQAGPPPGFVQPSIVWWRGTTRILNMLGARPATDSRRGPPPLGASLRLP